MLPVQTIPANQPLDDNDEPVVPGVAAVEYVMGIKFYPRQGQQQYAAFAGLWHRQAGLPGNLLGAFVGAWSFGTENLHQDTEEAFLKQTGCLQRVTNIQRIGPGANQTITIPATGLLNGVVDANGDPVQVAAAHVNGGLVIDFGQI